MQVLKFDVTAKMKKTEAYRANRLADYNLELSDSTAHLRCSCCDAGMKSICGFVRKHSRPYAMYYAALHENRADDFIRLSVSMGAGWENKDFTDRLALCVDITPRGDECAISVQDAGASPQQGLPAFGRWLDGDEARAHEALQEFMDVAMFIIQDDPAIRSYLAGAEIDWAGRKSGNGAR